MNVLQIIGFIGEIAKLSHQRHLSFMLRVKERAQVYLTEAFAAELPANLVAAIAQLNACSDSEDDAFKKQQGSDLTALIEQADKGRDDTLSGIRMMCEALLRIGTDAQKTAAQRVLRQLDLYKIKASDSYEDEGIKLQQLYQDFTTDATLVAATAECALTTQFTALNDLNEECRRLVNARNVERSATDSQAMNKARKALDTAYVDFVMLLNAWNVVTFNGSAGNYDQCIRVVNADIDYYKQWVLRIGGSGSAEGSGSSSEGGSGSGSGTGTGSGGTGTITPGGSGTTEPGTEDPTDPGTGDPTDPTDPDPTDPGTTNPIDPNEGPNPGEN